MDRNSPDIERIVSLLADYSNKIRFFYHQIETYKNQQRFAYFSLIFIGLSLTIMYLILRQEILKNSDWFLILFLVYSFAWFLFLCITNNKKVFLFKQELEEICVRFEKIVLTATHFHERVLKENSMLFLELDIRLIESERLLRRAETYISLKNKAK